ncbi:Protein tyrosine kinase Protein kinase domain [Trypanosoma vivax]|nr:Protein tyrosine kinase Protein kinase domain [Trypanosoma vivax]
MRECEVAYALQGHPNIIRLVDMFMSYRFDTHLHGADVRSVWKDEEMLPSNATCIVRTDGGEWCGERSNASNRCATKRSAATTASPGERYLSLVMAYHEKGDLGRWVREQKSEPMIPEATIVSIAFQVLTVLQFMHQHKPPIVHRDLKPENILLDVTTSRGGCRGAVRGVPALKKSGDRGLHGRSSSESIRIVVTDFGLSRVMDKTFCETGVGSLPYVAPECWQRHYSTKVDIWATGCILYAVCAKAC